MKPIPKDTGSFLKLRTAGQLYVDKTSYLHRIISSSDSCFFIARPRRFGKSLMITTLKEIFNGRKDLFEDLAIAKTDYDWKKYPVIHLDFCRCATKEGLEEFKRALANHVSKALAEAGCTYNPALSPGDNLGNAIDELYAAGKQTVLLIDEYDDPVAQVLDDVELAEKIRNHLATIYAQVKPNTEKLRFVMITGVSKFSKMSVFSTMSNLLDLSFKDEYATMLGYTEAELDEYFTDRMQLQAEAMEMTYEAYREELRRMYNGYRFFKLKGEKVYNPVSINLNLAEPGPEFECYWTSTGRASSLMNLIKRGDMLAIDPERVGAVKDSAFDVSDLRHLRPTAMLYQTGYLTIVDYNPKTKNYRLAVPDEEVRQDLAKVFASLLADKDTDWVCTLGAQLQEGEFETFFKGLKSLYAGLIYGSTEDSVHESSFARNLSVLLKSQGFRIMQEVATADGRIDLVADHPCGTYIFELKVIDIMRSRATAVLSTAAAPAAGKIAANPAAIAMSQAEAKAYAEPYLAPGKPVWLVGLSFERETRKFLEGVYKEVKIS